MLAASTDTINTGHAFVLVFNISSKQSLTELKPIVELINEVRNTLIMLLIFNDDLLAADSSSICPNVVNCLLLLLEVKLKLLANCLLTAC